MGYLAFALNVAVLTLNVALVARGDGSFWNGAAVVLTLFGILTIFPIVHRRLRGQ